MNTMELTIYFLIAFLGVCLSALFSGMETGIYTLNRVRLRVRSGNKEPSALRLRDEISKPDRLLSTLLIGNNLANYAGSFGIAAILELLGYTEWSAITLNVLLLTPILFVLGETLPKDLFRTHTDSWMYRLSGLLLVIRIILTITLLLPLIRSAGTLASRMMGQATGHPIAARQRISQLIREGAGVGVLSESQVTLADRALAMRERTIDSEMIPWRKVALIKTSATPKDRDALLRKVNYTRLPVIDAYNNVVGVISTLDAAIHRDKNTDDLLTDIFQLPSDTPITRALKLMRQEKQDMALAVHPTTRQRVGIVTLKDLVEPLTGELAAW